MVEIMVGSVNLVVCHTVAAKVWEQLAEGDDTAWRAREPQQAAQKGTGLWMAKMFQHLQKNSKQEKKTWPPFDLIYRGINFQSAKAQRTWGFGLENKIASC